MGSTGKSSKYDGFSITDSNGVTRNYKIVNGEVKFADDSPSSFLGIDYVDMIQKSYEQFGSTQAIIDRINNIGNGSARKLSDKEVEKLVEERNKDREKQKKESIKQDARRKGSSNRHRAYWSAM